MNDRSTLSILLPAKESRSFPIRLPVALTRLLLALGVPRQIAEAEAAAMAQFDIGSTSSRSILGCMNDASYALEYALHSGRYHSLEEVEMHLTGHIHGPSGHIPPGELAVELLSKVAHA